MLYKITNNLIAVDPKLYLTPQPSLSTRNNNPLQYQSMKITVKSKINKNRCKNLTHLQVFTGQLRCLDVLTLDQLFKLIQEPSINNCIWMKSIWNLGFSYYLYFNFKLHVYYYLIQLLMLGSWISLNNWSKVRTSKHWTKII
jgi:hypothetical protein